MAKRWSRRFYEIVDRGAKADWLQSRMLARMAAQHRRPISRLVSTRIRNYIRNAQTDSKYSVY